MSLILNIDTALEGALVCLARNGKVLQFESSNEQKEHAAWLHPAIEKLIKQEGCTLCDLQAVAVSIGPGSYTGLRVGLSAAKGFCYALDIPLITVGTLEILAASVQHAAADLICPLIDARRMEVYAAVYANDLKERIPPYSLVLDNNSFSELLTEHPVLFCGSGSKKLQDLISHPNAVFSISPPDPQAFAQLSFRHFSGKKFAELAYSEPLYIKEFYTPVRRN